MRGTGVSDTDAVGKNRFLRTLLHFADAHPLLFVFAVAMLARLTVVLFLTDVFSGSLVLDDGTYVQMAEQHVLGQDEHWDARTIVLFRSTSTFMIPLTALFYVFGAHAIVGQIFVALLGATTATLVTRIASEALARRWAIAAGLGIALMPSQVLWSSLVLKDAAVWAVLGALALLTAIGMRKSGAALWGVVLAQAVMLFLLAHLRAHTFVVAAWAMLMTAFLAAPDRWKRMLGSALVAILLPWLLGFGAAGYLLATQAATLEEKRLANAEGAQSAFVAPPEEPDIAEGVPAKPADVPNDVPPPVAEEEGSDALSGNISHLPKGLAAMLFRPYPWEQGASLSFLLARLETMVWYPVLLVALFGLPGAWHARLQMAFPAVMGAGIIGVYALAEGNIGTAYRHRGEFVWVILLFAGFGLSKLKAIASKRRDDKSFDRSRRVIVTRTTEPTKTMRSEKDLSPKVTASRD